MRYFSSSTESELFSSLGAAVFSSTASHVVAPRIRAVIGSTTIPDAQRLMKMQKSVERVYSSVLPHCLRSYQSAEHYDKKALTCSVINRVDKVHDEQLNNFQLL